MHRLKRSILIGLAFCFNPLLVAQANAENGNNESQKQSVTFANPAAQQFRIHGLSRFTGEQKDVLRQWLKEGVKATRQTLGDYPVALSCMSTQNLLISLYLGHIRAEMRKKAYIFMLILGLLCTIS